MKKREVLVHATDHAVLRWLERAHGIDVEAIRAHIENGAETGAAYGAVAVQIENIKLVLRDNGIGPDGDVLVTVAAVLPKGRIPHV
ncbi:hypothetical protein [Pelagibacterium halotolerans]|uniref:Uncharacterized protein n=1 Tax=Pelagibacterium halotolerans (strain DSM 22347 / JCM 15775 / CGMCC 1.7692 / B2) TaxID=1082931 RepID=G4RDE6_PELHB|nr:hypothetical protein [Pelagibacterium halotolerans]AEQ50772.1 hypothetical protein KKY_733 [Pelagibacterium halotolerans B2]QJR16983.1 hypothetical protein HKM20_13195 [Pelagibacterium halotolerans]